MVELLIPVRLSDSIVAEFSARHIVHKAWEAADEAAFLAQIAPRISAIATSAGILANGAVKTIDGPFMGQFPNLKLVANLGVGYDTIDAKWAAAHGIVVTNTPDVLTDETADTAFGLVLNTVRRFSAAERYLRAGKWLQAPFPLTATLRNKTMGILGLGRIGKAIAKRGEAFGLHIAYSGRSRQADVAYPYFATARELAAHCDILVVAAPGGPETRNIVNAEVLEALGPNGFLINIARGSLVDDEALIAALQKGTIAGAGLDVFVAEPQVPAALMDMERATLLPHVGSASVETREAMAKLFIGNVDSFAKTGRALTPVPECAALAGRQEG